MSIYEAVLKNAEPFFAWDVLSWLFIAMILAIIIVLIDLFMSKETRVSASSAVQEKSKFGKIAYFLIFLKFSKSLEICQRENRRIYFLDEIPIPEIFEKIRILKKNLTDQMFRNCSSEDLQKYAVKCQTS